MRWILPFLVAGPAMAQTSGWGAAPPVEKGFSWTDPLWAPFWMAWTPATLAVFVFIFSCMAILTVLELIWFRDGLERRGVLGLTTTLGDRLFISLLGSVFIFLGWLGLVGQPVWAPLGLAALWGTFVFWKV